jgi:hypothetical protein
LEWLYQRTDANKLRFRASLYYLEAMMVPSDMPEDIMKGVVERAEALASRLYAADTKAKRAERRKVPRRRNGHN